MEVLAVLPPFLSKHMLSVTPVVAQIPASFQPAPNPAEVLHHRCCSAPIHPP
jgi:hypothetical protein